MIKPEDIVLTRRDKFYILCRILDDIIPWQIPVGVAIMMLITHVIMLNNADWYFNLNHFSSLTRFSFCLVLGILESAALLAIMIPLEEKISNDWSSTEERYRKDAVKKVDEFLLSSRRTGSLDE